MAPLPTSRALPCREIGLIIHSRWLGPCTPHPSIGPRCVWIRCTGRQQQVQLPAPRGPVVIGCAAERRLLKSNVRFSRLPPHLQARAQHIQVRTSCGEVEVMGQSSIIKWKPCRAWPAGRIGPLRGGELLFAAEPPAPTPGLPLHPKLHLDRISAGRPFRRVGSRSIPYLGPLSLLGVLKFFLLLSLSRPIPVTQRPWKGSTSRDSCPWPPRHQRQFAVPLRLICQSFPAPCTTFLALCFCSVWSWRSSHLDSSPVLVSL
jgi:hypothetical protein